MNKNEIVQNIFQHVVNDAMKYFSGGKSGNTNFALTETTSNNKDDANGGWFHTLTDTIN